MHISGRFLFVVKGSASEHHIFLSFLTSYWDTITASSVFLFYHLIMAGSWSGYLIAFTAWRVGDTGDFSFSWLKTRCSNAHPPTSAQTEGSDITFFFFPFMFFFLGRIPEGTWLRRLVRMIPAARVWETRRVLSFCFPFKPCSCLMDDVYGLLRWMDPDLIATTFPDRRRLPRPA
ncbi:hypothetical protein N658DRAFT_20327 [Parathielavia hyrcaniae]|uniref:Uncharacterized protein n=1 Tax=Parathielavia hyrcaniae TaxID=113614 RepID=A0AAN6QAA3_9PEZI|nr:hypothetical protein N658DRAFT_20327 [Parathielavia hyrcaniae]